MEEKEAWRNLQSPAADRTSQVQHGSSKESIETDGTPQLFVMEPGRLDQEFGNQQCGRDDQKRGPNILHQTGPSVAWLHIDSQHKIDKPAGQNVDMAQAEHQAGFRAQDHHPRRVVGDHLADDEEGEYGKEANQQVKRAHTNIVTR